MHPGFEPLSLVSVIGLLTSLRNLGMALLYQHAPCPLYGFLPICTSFRFPKWPSRLASLASKHVLSRLCGFNCHQWPCWGLSQCDPGCTGCKPTTLIIILILCSSPPFDTCCDLSFFCIRFLSTDSTLLLVVEVEMNDIYCGMAYCIKFRDSINDSCQYGASCKTA